MLRVVASEHSGLVPRRAAIACGLVGSDLRSALRSGRLTPVRRGLYRHHEFQVDPPNLTVVVESIPGAVASGFTAARAYGWPLPADIEPVVEVSVGRSGRAVRPAVVIHKVALSADERCLLPWSGGVLQVTSPLRTALDVVRRLGLDDAVVFLDSVRRSGLLREAELRDGLRSRSGCRGIVRAQQALALSCDGVDSPLETRGRLIFVRAGFLPTTQYPLRISPGRVVRVDLGFEDIRLLVEFDGFEYHRDRRAYRADRERWNAAVREGWWMLRFTYEDVANRPRYLIDCVRAVVARAA